LMICWCGLPRKRLNAEEKRARKAAAVQLFAKQCGRKAHAGHDPNDRAYNRDTVEAVRRMRPEELDRLLRDGEED
jgi:hypothetical protein